MKIDIVNLISNKLSVKENLEFSLELLKNTEIKQLKNVCFEGSVYYDYNDNLLIEGQIAGIMVLEDAYTLELVDYNFSCDIEETITKEELKSLKNIQKSENTLDITDILWQNIVLEVPISFSNKKETPNLKGEGWELVNNVNKKQDPRLAKLAELLEEGKE